MTEGITGIDHLLVGVRDLEAARRAYQHLGFTVSPRGRHIGWGTANYCVMFPGSYIELLGIVDPAQFTNNLDRFLEQREGLLGVAFASDDAELAARELAGRGIETDAAKDLSRKLELPEGEVEPAFKLVHLPAAVTPGMPAFICQHLTRELVWQQPWLDHSNGARALHSVTGVVADPGEVALAYGRLFGEEAVWADRGQVTVETGAGSLRFTTAEGLAQLYPGLAAAPAHAVPWLAGLRLTVANVNATAGYLDAAGVRYLRDGDTLLRLGPDYACGVAIEFAAG
jgi:catechol 2,3-dioxygenase-like lactoylglutathione lyase family enzyme